MADQNQQKIEYHIQVMNDFYEWVNNVRKKSLHEGQIKVLRALLRDSYKEMQCQWGRSCGKTECGIAAAWLWALLNSNSLIYIIAPQRAHGKKIYWTPGRLQGYGPQKYIQEARDSELILVFNNGSKIVIDGSENHQALRGIKPNLVIYDEFQDHSREFDVEVMEPNRVAKSSALLVMGTPPKVECYYDEYKAILLDAIKKGDETKLYLEIPSWYNPSLDKDELAKIKKKLYARGDEKIWLREYEAKSVTGGADMIFPMFDSQTHVYSHHSLMKLLARDVKKMWWIDMYDPGSTSCFAALFVAINPYTSQIYILDEIYEKDRRATTSSRIWERALKMKAELNSNLDMWRGYYDEAAAWFANEVRDMYGSRFPLQATQKHRKPVSSEEGRAGESLLKDVMSAKSKFLVSSRCVNTIWELNNYVITDGKYPKKNDHCIDLLHYLVLESGYEFNEIANPDQFYDDDNEDREVRRLPKSLETVYKEYRGKRELMDETNDTIDFETEMEGSLWN